MKVYCKRTKFNKDDNHFSIGYVKWKKGVWYEVIPANQWESGNGIICHIMLGNSSYGIKKSEFDKYFIKLEDWRDLKLKDLLDE